MSTSRKLKPKKCRSCGNAFIPMNSMAKTCSIDCAIKLSKSDLQKKADREAAKIKRAERRANRAAREKVKPLSKWLSEAQAVVNRYVRLRDKYDGCISCDKPSTWSGQWHASHFHPRGRAANVRFNLHNIHKSCSVCNNHLSGNLAEYKPRLIEKIGQEKFDQLEELARDPKRFDAEYCKKIKRVFNKKIKRLEAKC